MISFPLRTIFIHIPKCAGTSVENAIWPRPEDRVAENLWGSPEPFVGNPLQSGAYQHLTATHVRGIYPTEFETFWKFSIVRNPFDRLVSQYYYTLRGRTDLLRYLGFSEIKIRFGRVRFDDYVERIVERAHVQWKPMTYFLTDIMSGGTIVDYCARLENLTEDWKVIRDRLGITADLGKDKVSHDRPPYREVFDQRSRRLAEEYYRIDLETFGYEF